MNEIERFAFARGAAVPDETGGWVRHSDHLAALAKVREELRERLREEMLSDEAIEAAGHASRTFAAFAPTSPQTWEAVPAADKALIREAARIDIGAALAALQPDQEGSGQEGEG